MRPRGANGNRPTSYQDFLREQTDRNLRAAQEAAAGVLAPRVPRVGGADAQVAVQRARGEAAAGVLAPRVPRVGGADAQVAVQRARGEAAAGVLAPRVPRVGGADAPAADIAQVAVQRARGEAAAGVLAPRVPRVGGADAPAADIAQVAVQRARDAAIPERHGVVVPPTFVAQRAREAAVNTAPIGVGLRHREPNALTRRYGAREFAVQKQRDLCSWAGCLNPRGGGHARCQLCTVDSQIGINLSYCFLHRAHNLHLVHMAENGLWVDVLSRSTFLRGALGIGNQIVNIREMSLRLHRAHLCPSTFFNNRGNFDRLCDDVQLASCIL
jgi:hypothetical protein